MTLILASACGGETMGDGGVCPAGTARCDGVCVDLRVDPTSCGACGNACAAGEVCDEGTCGLTCAAEREACGGVCVDTMTDPAHCGGCDAACATAEVCEAGRCQASCSSDLMSCGGSCRDLETDREHCGGCSLPCLTGEICRLGDCVPSCGGGAELCGSTCTDLSSDESHCGRCDIACAEGEICTDGRCQLVCPDGQVICDGRCTDLDIDRRHCGSCTESCRGGQLCSGGMCMATCGTGYTECSGTCRDLMNDSAHCGMCGRVCPPSHMCSGGGCVCRGGRTECPGGTCHDLMTDPMSCGTCGRVCPAEHVCSSGSCVCSGGRTECPGGTCHDLTSDPANCGMCGRACSSGEVCTAGSCVCAPGTTDCSGTCASLGSDPDNCGMCGRVCPAGMRFCSGGSCFAPPPPITTTVPPAAISGALSCTSRASTLGRKVGVDAVNDFYAIMLCAGSVYETRSLDGGATWSIPALLMPGVLEAAVEGGPAGTAYVAGVTSTQVLFSRTTDSGLTWSAPAPIGTASARPPTVSIASRADDVWVGVMGGGGPRVYRNGSRGAGAFAFADVPTPIFYFDVVVEPATGGVWLMGDAGIVEAWPSPDGGATFGPPFPLMTFLNQADWAMANGAIFGAGAGPGTSIVRLDLPLPGETALTSTVVGDAVPDTRSIAADAAGNAYTVSVSGFSPTGPITLERVLAGTTSFRDPRVLSMVGSAPSVAAVEGSPAAVVVFTEGTTVYATTQVF